MSTVSAVNLFTPEPENDPQGIAFDSSGNFYVASSGSNEILEYSSTGNFKGIFVTAGKGGLSDPQGIAFDATGNLYVASRATNQVLEYNASGGYVGVFAADDGSGDLNEPEFLKFDASGNLYVSTFGSSEVLRYHPNGTADPGLNATTGLPNPGAEFVNSTEGLVGAYGLAFDSGGNLYVASNENDEVVEFDTNGETVGPVLFSSNTPNAPTGIAIDTGVVPNVLYVASGNGTIGSTVQEFSLNTTTSLPIVVTGTFIQTAIYGGQLGENTPTGIILNRNGANTTLFLASSATNQIIKYSGTDVSNKAGYAFTTFQTNGVPFTAPTLLDPQGLTFRPAITTTPTSARGMTLYVVSGEGTDANFGNDASTSTRMRTGGSSSTASTPAGSATGWVPTRRLAQGFDDPEPLETPEDSVVWSGTDSGGNAVSYVFVASKATNEILAYNAKSGAYVGIFVTQGTLGLNKPQGMAVQRQYIDMMGNTKDLNVFVASTGTNQVLQFQPVVTFNAATNSDTLSIGAEGVFATTGVAMDGLVFSSPIAMDGKGGGDLLIADDTNNQVIRYDRFGIANPDPLFGGATFIAPGLAGLNHPTGLAVQTYLDSNNKQFTVLFVSSFNTNQVLYYYYAAPDVTNGVYATNANLNGPERIAFLSQDLAASGTPQLYMYVANYNSNNVVRYNATSSTGGAFSLAYILPSSTTTVGTANAILQNPTGLTLDAKSGSWLVSSEATNVVLSYTEAIGLTDHAIGNGISGYFTPEDLNSPLDLKFQPNSFNLYVVSSGSNEVIEYGAPALANDPSAAPVYIGISVSAGLGGLSVPQGLAFDTSGSAGASNLMFVSSLGLAANPLTQNEVFEYTLVNGLATNPVTFVASGAGGLDGPEGLVYDPYALSLANTQQGGLLVVSSQTNIVLLYDLETQNVNTKVIASTGGFLSEFTPEALDDPTGLTFDAAGDLFVASTGSQAPTDQNGNRVLEYTFPKSSTTVGVTRFTSQDLELHPLTTPPAIPLPNDAVVGPDGNVYVASTYNNEILEYSGITGQFINVFVTTNSGGLLRPTGLAFDSTGTYLYVVSSGNTEILQYYASGRAGGPIPHARQ